MNHLNLTNLLLIPKGQPRPQAVDFTDTLPPYLGQPDEATRETAGVAWALYGKTQPDRYAHALAKHGVVLQIDWHYRIDQPLSRLAVPLDVFRGGLDVLHLGWISTDFRKSLVHEWSQRLLAEHPGSKPKHNLKDIAVEHPEFAVDLLKANPHLNVIIHPVRTTSPLVNLGEPIWIATARVIPENTVHLGVRRVDGIKVHMRVSSKRPQ